MPAASLCSAFENGDVNVPSPEALFRNILLGNEYFDKNFGKRSCDIFLPDCFGFGYALPSIMHHANLKGFTTQKLTWGSAYGVPFDLGKWYGVDGNYVYGNTNPGSYTSILMKVRDKKLVKEKLADNIILMDIKAPRVAKECLPGQFIIAKTDEVGERIPLTICDYDRENETVTIVVQTIGAGTERMMALEEGDELEDFVGPLGCPSELCEEKNLEETKKKKIIFIAGGLGTAPVYPQVKWLHEHGVDVDVIMGFRSQNIVFFEEEMKAVAGNVYVATDDGTYGFHGNGSQQLEALVNAGNKYDVCVAIGPMIMMKFTCLLTKKLEIPTIVSMNPIMVDGTGMCGACRLVVGGEVKFACVDGPEFDGHLVDFDQAMKRQQQYKTEEGRAKLAYEEGDTHHGGCGHCGGDK